MGTLQILHTLYCINVQEQDGYLLLPNNNFSVLDPQLFSVIASAHVFKHSNS